MCYIAFVNDEESSLKLLKNQYPNALYQKHRDQIQQNAKKFILFIN
ncbi:hypothetical protein ACFX2S_12925 [Gilliamella apicola]